LAAPAPFKLKIPNGRWREPDVCYLLPRNLGRYRTDWWDYADLAIEVVSPDDPNRDYVTKRADYASAGVPEYWIVDPAEEKITILSLDNGTYREVGQVRPGGVANSLAVPGFSVDFTALLTKARRRTPGNPAN
jgi:Uma2 family endonuclease